MGRTCLLLSTAMCLAASAAVAEQAGQDTVIQGVLRDAAFDRVRPDSSPLGRPLRFSDPAAWRTDTLTLGPTERISLTRQNALSLSDGAGPRAARDFDDPILRNVAYQRDWPGALKGRAGKLAFDVTTRAGIGVGGSRGTAGAGATVRFGEDLEEKVVARVTDALGVKTVDGESFGDRGRWYVFAAADGQAVGLNLLRNKDGDWGRGGWSSEPASLIGEAQVGVGWKRGAVQASFGYLHREIKVDGIHNAETTKMEDGAVAFSVSIKPAR